MADLPDVGSRIGGYVVEGVLGRGGMGIVYRARHEILEREAAVKVLLAELSSDPAFRTRFLRESKMAARLSRHPNVLPVYDAGESGGLLFLAMYLVDGPSLAQVLREGGPLDPDRAVEVVRQVAGALDVAHSQGLVHRDVKPANILIEPRPGGGDHCFLGDFGLLKEARSSGGLTSTNVMVGTLDYMAPEQLDPRVLGGEPVDGRVDVYALGCVLYECLTGARPFADVDSDTALIVAHLSRMPPRVTDSRPDLPQAIDDVIAGAMAKSRDDRPESAGAFAEEAARALSGASAIDSAATLVASAPPSAPDVEAPALAIVIPPAAPPPPAPQAAPPVVPPPVPAPAGPHAPSPPSTMESPPPAPPKRRRRSLLLLVGIPVLAVVVVVAVILASSGGGSPTGQAPPPRADSVWATGGTMLTRFDPTTGHTLARIAVGTNPVAVAVDANAVWVANNGDGTVSRIDPTTNKVVATIDVGQEPFGIASDGTSVWVSLRAENSVAEIDPATNTVVGTVRVGEHPEGLAADAQGVWVACYDDGVVTRVDPDTRKVVTRVKVGENPTTAVFGEGSVWVPTQFGSAVVRVDPSTNKVIATVGAGPQPIDVAVSGPFLWVVDDQDQHRMYRIEIDSQRVQAVDGFGDLLHVTSGAGVIWVADTDQDDVQGLDRTDGTVLRRLHPRDEPAGIAVG